MFIFIFFMNDKDFSVVKFYHFKKVLFSLRSFDLVRVNTSKINVFNSSFANSIMNRKQENCLSTPQPVTEIVPDFV